MKRWWVLQLALHLILIKRFDEDFKWWGCEKMRISSDEDWSCFLWKRIRRNEKTKSPESVSPSTGQGDDRCAALERRRKVMKNNVSGREEEGGSKTNEERKTDEERKERRRYERREKFNSFSSNPFKNEDRKNIVSTKTVTKNSFFSLSVLSFFSFSPINFPFPSVLPRSITISDHSRVWVGGGIKGKMTRKGNEREGKKENERKLKKQ